VISVTVFKAKVAHDVSTKGEEGQAMIALREVHARLAGAGHHNRYWGHSEARELQHIIMPEEQVVAVVNGRYENGFAMLVATDRRILLIDKKPLFLSMEDLRYDMIAEVDYYSNLINATLCIRTINQALTFTSIRAQKLRRLTAYTQQRVMELRQHTPSANQAMVQLPQQASTSLPVTQMQSEQPVLPQSFVGYPTGPLTVHRRPGYIQPPVTNRR
jgi:hypothetical protein